MRNEVETTDFDGSRVRVKRYLRDGFEENIEMVAVEVEGTEVFATIDGTGTREIASMNTVARFPRERASAILRGLAELYDYELREK